MISTVVLYIESTKKLYNMYISVFRWGRGRREIIFRMWKQKSKRCAMPSIVASYVAAKRNFRDALLDLVGINLRICGISIDPGNRRRCFWRRQRAVWAISGSCHQPRSRRRSVSCDRVNVNKPKLQKFDRPLGLPGHLHGSIWRTQRVISLKYDGAGA